MMGPNAKDIRLEVIKLPETLAGLHFLAFAIVMLKSVVQTMLIVHSS
jgi:hypothetical protein